MDEGNSANGKQKREGHCIYNAFCPLCGEAENVVVLSNEQAAQDAARLKVLTHIRLKHPELVDGSADADQKLLDKPTE